MTSWDETALGRVTRHPRVSCNWR